MKGTMEMFRLPTNHETLNFDSELIKHEPKTLKEEVDELYDKVRYQFMSSQCIRDIKGTLLTIFAAHGIDITNLTIRIEEHEHGNYVVKYLGPRAVLDKIYHELEEKDV